MKDVKEEETIDAEHLNLAHGTAYSFLYNYSVFIFQILTSILLARLLSQELWGFLILVNSYISIIILLLSFLPPSLNNVLNYAIPKYISLDQKENIKSIIKYSLCLKLIFIFPVFLISLLIFYFLSSLFLGSLNGYLILLFIYSPLIFINGLESIYIGIYRGFNNFKIILILILVKNLLYIGTLLFYLIFLNNVSIIIVAYTNLICFISTFFLSTLIVLRKYRDINKVNNNNNNIKFKEYFQEVLKYGSNISVGIFINEFWKQIEVISIGYSQSPSLVTGYSLANYYKEVGQSASASFTYPLLTSFSKIASKKFFKRITIYYNIIFKYSLHLSLLIAGLMIFSAYFFLVLVYGENYIGFLPLLTVYIFYILFTGLNSSFDAYLMLEKNSKYIIPIRIIFVLTRSCLFLLFLIFYDVFLAILGIVIANFIIFGFQMIISIKIFNIRIDLLNTIKQYIIFIISFTLSLLLHILILNDLYRFLLETLNLEFIMTLPLITIISYLFIYFGLTKFLNVFSIKEIELMKALFSKKNIIHRAMRKILNLLK
ncbi:MAG: lipopolysaccharide biosynthesis protein [Candidatus Lokiarchaeia archaeon]